MTNTPLSVSAIAALIEIQDSNVDAPGIRLQVAEALAMRRGWAERQGISYDSIVAGQDRSSDTMAGRENLLSAIAALRSTPARPAVSLFLTPTALPIFGGLLQRVRTMLHNVAVYYVNAAASKQATFNQAVVSSFAELERTEPNREEIAALKARIGMLEREVGELQKEVRRRMA